MMIARLFAFAALFLPLLDGAALAQGTPVKRVGFLSGTARATDVNVERLEVLTASLAALGWRLGSTLALEERYTDGDTTRMPVVAAELARAGLDAIVVTGTTEVRTMSAAAGSIPIVFLHAADPVGDGLVASIRRPGGNITGLAMAPRALMGKRLEIMTDLLGERERLVWIYDPAGTGNVANWSDGQAAASYLGVRLERFALGSATDVDTMLASIAGADGVVVGFGLAITTRMAEIVTATTRHRLPTIFESRHPVMAGGLLSFGPDLREIYRRAAGYVDRILRGAKPGDLPVEQASRFELVVNLKTAKTIGFTVPSAILDRADEVIE